MTVPNLSKPVAENFKRRRLKFISSLFFAMWMDTWNWMSLWICKRAFKIMNFDYGMEVIVNDYPINDYIQKKIFNECDWINWIWIWLVISCSVWLLITRPGLSEALSALLCYQCLFPQAVSKSQFKTRSKTCTACLLFVLLQHSANITQGGTHSL